MKEQNHSRNIETILFVDDEESILEIAAEYFQKRGYRVITANNGREAVSLLKKEKVDCCFTDINMPEMDGLELAEHIRQHDNTIPVIIMTGYPSVDNTIRTLKNGVVDFLIKPVKLNQMELCVRRVLRERQLFINNILLTKEVEGKARLEALSRELIAKVNELNTLNSILTAFTSMSSGVKVFQRLVELAVSVIGADESRFFIMSDFIENPFVIASAKGDHRTENQPVQPIISKQLNGDEKNGIKQILKQAAAGSPLLIPQNNGKLGLSDKIQSFMGTPLTIRHKLFGVLTACITAGAKRFSEKDLFYLSFMTHNAAYAIENTALYENIYENLFSTLYAFVKAIEAKDPYTKEHSNRVTDIAIILGKAMSCSAEEIEILNVAGRLHDIGKIGVRDNILLKPGRLNSEEYKIIMEHSAIGADIVGQLGFWDREQEIIRHHHERYDGSGYPDGLSGNQIPFLARILSVADVFDAMASNRIYRKKMEINTICSIIRQNSGTQFDPNVVKAFNQLHDKGVLMQFEESTTSPTKGRQGL